MKKIILFMYLLFELLPKHSQEKQKKHPKFPVSPYLVDLYGHNKTSAGLVLVLESGKSI